MLYKCKICGGQLNINKEDKLTTCPYCGSIQTIPNLEDEKINRLFDRGNELIRNCQFDDAINKFEEILSLRNDDSEVYWSLLMAKFGVIYEKDPYTGNMIPTIHRNQETSIYLDEDYKLTLKYADFNQKEYCEKTAKIIDNIQNKYNTISKKEKPFDIFICYKQTDDNTKQDTEDYKIAYDLYNSLNKEGYKVFFSHVTLEDKIGEEYEPYIYAALKSSKVLLAIGTKQEYYNAVWVKNEWSRFMHMMANDYSKRIIPICTNTSVLPNEFNKYQAIQISNNIIWKEDLIRYINKSLSEDKINVSSKDRINNNDNEIKHKNSGRTFIFIMIIVAVICVTSYVIKNDNSNNNQFINTQENVTNNSLNKTRYSYEEMQGVYYFEANNENNSVDVYELSLFSDKKFCYWGIVNNEESAEIGTYNIVDGEIKLSYKYKYNENQEISSINIKESLTIENHDTIIDNHSLTNGLKKIYLNKITNEPTRDLYLNTIE